MGEPKRLWMLVLVAVMVLVTMMAVIMMVMTMVTMVMIVMMDGTEDGGPRCQ